MSEPELAYMTGNDDFDLPRWQTGQVRPDSNTSHSMYSPTVPPPSLTAGRLPPSHQSPTTTRQPRINQIVEEDNQFGVAPIQYTPGSLSRSASMNSATSRRRHDIEEAPTVDSQRPFPGGSKNANSLYPSSVPYPPQQSGNTAEAPYHDIYYNASPSHPPKRSQTQHDPATSNRSGRSPLRHGPLSSQSALDSYSSQQAQYSPTTGNAGYNYPDQQHSQQRSYNPGAYQQTHNRGHSNPENPDSPYQPTSNQPSLSPGGVSNPAHLAPRSVRQNSSSVPSSPLAFSHHPIGGMQEGPNSNHYYPQEPQPMMVEPAAKRKLAGFRRVRDASDLHPITSRLQTGKRMDGSGNYLSPIRQLTTNLVDTYHICNPQFRYESTHNPRRVLTKPSKPAHNDGYDNEDYDYILYVNDWLGTDDGHKYLILDILGQGTFGQVVKCQNMKTHEIVAVKVVKNKPAYFNQSMMEVTILELLNNQCDPNDEHHILRLRDSFIHRSHLCLVFELLSSNLYELIKQNQFQGLSTQLVKVFTAQLLDALTVLKEARLIHCDLKPENILLKSLQSPQIKVIDFGSACHERQTVYTYIQSRFYRSPEVLLGIPYNAAIDMWSLGCIAVELFLGLPLFPGTSEYNQITRIVEMLGMPPSYMMDLGKQTGHFFDSYTDAFGHKKYRLKTLEQYSRERNTSEQPGKQYFKATTLPDIINQAPMPNFKSSRHGTEMEKELNNRASFIDFCQGLLNLNPVERWTPQQARQHPFITGEKFTKPWSPHTQPVPQPSPQHSVTPVDPKRPYGGLVPSQPKGTRAFQDAASYNQHLAQQQAYTAQATAQANTFINRNPYITQPTGNGPPTFQNNQDKTGAGYSHPINSNTSTQQYLGPSSFPVPHNNQPPPPPSSYYPNSNARPRAGNVGPMDSIPPALARLQHMSQDVIGGRNALTPVLKRDDPIREWERRQTGKVAAAQPYPQLEYLHQQAEIVASQGLANWHPGPGSGSRYTGVGGTGQPPPTSGLAHTYHIPQTNQALVVDEDRKDVVMSSVRNAARSDGPNTAFGAASDAVTSPTQVYTTATTTGNRYPAYSQSSQQSQPSSDISNLYVPMQPDQFVGYQGSAAQNQATSRVPGSNFGGGGPTLPTSFYPGGVNASGQVQGGVKDARKQSNPEIWPR